MSATEAPEIAVQELSDSTKAKAMNKKGVISCEFCSKTFKFQAMLRQHEKVHYGIKQFECEECHRRFLHKSTLKVHLRLHTGEKPYKCPHCPKEFHGQTALNCHVFWHTKDGVKCPQCPKVFATSSIVKQHQKQVHTNERPHICNLCGMRYKHIHNLRIHLRNHQNRVCPECGTGFDSVYAMLKHRKGHIVENLPFKCKYCYRAFAARSKLISHANLRGRPYQCELCCHSFNKQHYLENHQRRIHWMEMGLERLKIAEPQNGWNRKGVAKSKRTKPTTNTEWEENDTHLLDKEEKMANLENRVPVGDTNESTSNGSIEQSSTCMPESGFPVTASSVVEDTVINDMEFNSNEKLVLASIRDKPSEMNTSKQIEPSRPHSKEDIICTVEKEKNSRSDELPEVLCNGFDGDQSCTTQQKEKPNSEALICELCGNWYASATTLAVHRANQHHSQRFPCNQCPRTFGFHCYLKKHVRTEHQHERISCQMCDKTFKYAQDLKVHLRHHEESKPFKCNQCPSAFRFPSALRSHVLLHQKEHPFKCDICGKHFRFQNNLRVHKRLHVGIKHYKCDVCEREFSTKAPMIRHKKVHEKGRELRCVACEAVFYKKVDLAIHQSKEHPNHVAVGKVTPIYTCQHCGREFAKKCNLTAHSYTHENVYRFPCKLCNQSFKQHAGLRNHMISAHKQAKLPKVT